MNITQTHWYLLSDILQRPILYNDIKTRLLEEEGGIILNGTIVSIELDRRIIKYEERNPESYVNHLQTTDTMRFEGEFKNVYIFKVPMESDVANIKPFIKRGMSGYCYQAGSVGHQICGGPKWVHAGGNEILVSPKTILGLFYKTPTITAQAVSLAKAVLSEVKNIQNGGSVKVTEETFVKRKEICLQCDYYDPSAFLNTGRCRVCGCGVGKLQMPNQECPKGKWGKEVRE
jgi:hypothetical protein